MPRGVFGVPALGKTKAVDIYGVGSSLLRNDKRTNTDFTADVVRVKVDGVWRELAKVGRAARHNPELEPVDLAAL